MDRYLNVIFETLADMNLGTASAVADRICSGIFVDCLIVLDGSKNREKSNFFELVKKYIDEHLVDFKEDHTKVEFYAGNIIIENLEILYREFQRRYKEKFLTDMDYPVVNECFKKISDIIGVEKMKKFNDVMTEAFMPSAVGISVIQQFLHRLWGCFLTKISINLKKFIK